MISLRTLVRFTSVAAAAAAALSLAACKDGPANPLSRGLEPGGASYNSTKTVTAHADARVLLDKAGNAVLEVHTGTFVDATNTATPEGTLSSLTYTVKNGSKTISSHTVSFTSKATSSYITWLNLCKTSGDDDDDDDGDNSWSSCSSKWVKGYKVSYTATVKGLGSDGKSTGTVGADADVLALPDVDLSQSLVTIAGVPNVPASSVPANVATTFSVDVPNHVIQTPSNTVTTGAGVSVSCLVMVDGIPQLPLPNGVYNKYLNPNAYGYLGDPVLNIPASGHAPCQFTLTLPPGAHKVVVTGIVIYPGDYDLTNNSTVTFTVTAGTKPTQIAAGPLQVELTPGSPVNLDPPPSGGAPQISPLKAVVLDQVVTLVDGAAPGQVTCAATITPTVPAGSPVSKTVTANLTTAPGVSCAIPFTFPDTGLYQYQVDITPTDGVPADNHKGPVTIHVTNPAAFTKATVGDISVVGAGGAKVALTDTIVHSGELTNYSADIAWSALAGTPSATLTCSVKVDGVSVPATTWDQGSGSISTTTGTKKCLFGASITDATTTTPGSHTILVTVTADVANLVPGGPGPNSASNTANVSVATRIDLKAGAFVIPGPPQTPLTGTLIKQVVDPTNPTMITIRAPITGPANAQVNCLALGIAPGTFNSAAAFAALAPSAPTASTISLGATGSNFCEYKINTPLELGLGSFPLVASVESAIGALDPTPNDHTSTGTLTMVSNGAFTSLPKADEILVHQDWTNAKTDADYPVAPTGTLTNQLFQVQHLALLVVPTATFLGKFGLTGTVTAGPNGSVSFGSNGLPFQLLGPSTGSTVCNNVTQSGFNPLEPALSFTAQICSVPAKNSQGADLPGYQAITVSYSVSSGNLLGSASPLMFTNEVVMKIQLDFNLDPSSTQPNDKVVATVRVPIVNNVNTPCGFDNLAAPGKKFCSTVFGAAVITSP